MHPLSSRPLQGNTNADCAGSLIIKKKLFVHQSLRVAHFHTLLSSIHPDGAIPSCVLLTLLASVGQLALESSRAISSASTNIASSRSDPEPMLNCAFCNASIPLSDLARHEPRSRAHYTAELVAGLLVTRHLEQCKGRRGGSLMRADDVHYSVAECGTLANQITETLSGTYVILQNTRNSLKRGFIKVL